MFSSLIYFSQGNGERPHAPGEKSQEEREITSFFLKYM
jgi:hypothetical protein